MTEQLLSRFQTAEEEQAFMYKLAEEHPYFAPAQFYRLKKAFPGTGHYNRLMAVNALLFNNNRWLNFQLSESMASPDARKPSKEDTSLIPVTAEIDDSPHPDDTTAPLIVTGEEAIPDRAVTTAEADHDGNTEVTTVPDEHPASGTAVSEYDNEETTLDPDETANNDDNPLPPLPTIRPAKESVGPLIFEAYHTVDYFASLGIKLSEEMKSGDKLSIQLKSFTDWLKSMKKIHDLPAETAINDDAHEAIQNIAEKSNKQDEVLTEAMAEVYIQQGKPRKARQVYEKLSLLNPSKSAYFAAKIENLKGN